MGIRREIQHESENQDNSISFEEALKKIAEATKEKQKQAKSQEEKRPPEKEAEEHGDEDKQGK